MKRAYPTAALVAGLAAFCPSAFAQTSDWSGFSLGISAGQGMKDDNGGETVVFDTNRDGTFDDTVRTALALMRSRPASVMAQPPARRLQAAAAQAATTTSTTASRSVMTGSSATLLSALWLTTQS